jgi:hypothetical protein
VYCSKGEVAQLAGAQCSRASSGSLKSASGVVTSPPLLSTRQFMHACYVCFALLQTYYSLEIVTK